MLCSDDAISLALLGYPFLWSGGGGLCELRKSLFLSATYIHLVYNFCSAFLFAYWAAAMKGGFGHLRRAFWSHISNGALEGGEATCL